MTYQSLLPEVAAGNVEPRHVVIPLRRALTGVHIVSGQVIGLRHADRTARVRLVDGGERELRYDHVVVAPGAVARTAPVPGLAELTVGFKTLGEAVFLRNRVLIQLSLAASTTDPNVRRRALTFVVAGGWFAGIEALGELSDLPMTAIEAFEGLRPEELRWILVDATDRILPSVSPELSEYTANVLRERGVPDDWTGGDCAAVPDLSSGEPGALCLPSTR